MKIGYVQYLKSIAMYLVFLTLPFALVEQFIFQKASQVEDKITYGILGIILGLIESFLVLILLGYGIKLQTHANLLIGKHYKKYLRDLIVESLRAMGRIAVGFLLIVPGIKRAIEYYLIPFIVQFDSNYEDGKVDALLEAKSLLQGHFLRFSLLLCLTQIVIFMLQIAAINFNLFTSPLAWILFYIAEIGIQAGVFLFFYNYYLKLKTGKV